jgi:hypothetical protein
MPLGYNEARNIVFLKRAMRCGYCLHEQSDQTRRGKIEHM